MGFPIMARTTVARRLSRLLAGSKSYPTGSKNAKRNQPRAVATISPDAETSLRLRRHDLVQKRMERHRRRVLKFKEAGDARMAEHALKMGEKAVVRYRREGILK